MKLMIRNEKSKNGKIFIEAMTNLFLSSPLRKKLSNSSSDETNYGLNMKATVGLQLAEVVVALPIQYLTNLS
jgi:hypothetical protein